ncbi:hypothetical protein [Cellulomonas hominis]
MTTEVLRWCETSQKNLTMTRSESTAADGTRDIAYACPEHGYSCNTDEAHPEPPSGGLWVQPISY